jgi:hypothetical protein
MLATIRKPGEGRTIAASLMGLEVRGQKSDLTSDL